MPRLGLVYRWCGACNLSMASPGGCSSFTHASHRQLRDMATPGAFLSRKSAPPWAGVRVDWSPPSAATVSTLDGRVLFCKRATGQKAAICDRNFQKSLQIGTFRLCFERHKTRSKWSKNPRIICHKAPWTRPWTCCQDGKTPANGHNLTRTPNFRGCVHGCVRARVTNSKKQRNTMRFKIEKPRICRGFVTNWTVCKRLRKPKTEKCRFPGVL